MAAFNQMDNLLGEIIETVLSRLGRVDLVRSCVEEADFALRLRVIDLLKHSTEGDPIAHVPVGLMREIAGERNVLAHDHFDQNPFDGSYRLAARGRKKAPYYSAERIDDLTKKAIGGLDGATSV